MLSYIELLFLKAQKIVFDTHKKNPEIKFDLELEESSGTVQLFYMLLALLDVCKHGKTLVIDEFDLSLHNLQNSLSILFMLLKMPRYSLQAIIQILLAQKNSAKIRFISQIKKRMLLQISILFLILRISVKTWMLKKVICRADLMLFLMWHLLLNQFENCLESDYAKEHSSK